MFTIAILISDGFDEWAVKGSKPFFKSHNYKIHLISPKDGEFVRSWTYKDWGASYAIDKHIEQIDPKLYDALLMPGGALSVDNLRTNPHVLEFVNHFVNEQKPIGTLCHGIWPLVELGVVANRKLTSVTTIRTDIKNAGGIWIDESSVRDGMLVSSRTSEDLDAFLALFNTTLENTLADASPSQADR
ncbi:DJ-1/PfpI family protein [Sphingobacterium paludis]|jgi:protease I|uniref:Protease I n=1 Tax=Sphingobacterium paludis TaxID=1476465 RepID=A0A4R7D2U3_9SPHI|nr:DJ-1/PfpI family protein [Sphingobacterium paludis]TDS13136.1 protease I [Sphingobacterium paludis]